MYLFESGCLFGWPDFLLGVVVGVPGGGAIARHPHNDLGLRMGEDCYRFGLYWKGIGEMLWVLVTARNGR
ncbi:MAG TPA: hypothetical protein DIS96_04555 [Pusillimonas sp.]|nr:hypothetical protein [Pusillimonas sp.]